MSKKKFLVRGDFIFLSFYAFLAISALIILIFAPDAPPKLQRFLFFIVYAKGMVISVVSIMWLLVRCNLLKL